MNSLLSTHRYKLEVLEVGAMAKTFKGLLDTRVPNAVGYRN